MNVRKTNPGRALTLAISAITAMSAGSSLFAQEADIEQITVTGSRIQRDVGFESAVPVTALSSDELNMFEPGLGVSEQLENLPQYFGNISSDNVGGRVTADVGQSQLNMRGMGGERTLVLLDGSRVVPSDRRSSVSVDYLPSTLIQRVDVVTGGASAAYGADALAGVTNFVLNRSFTGLDVAVRTGINEEGDGEYTRGSVTFGTDLGDDDRLHIFGALEARVNDGYRRDNADWDKDYNYVLNPDWTPTSGPGTPIRLTRPYVYDTEFSPTGLIRQGGFSLDRYQFTEDGNGVRPWEDSDFISTGGANNQNSQAGAPGDYQYELWRRGHPQSFERVGVELQTAFLGADFQLTDATTLWGHALYGRTKNTPVPTSSGAAGTGLGHGTLAFMTVYPENPFLPDDVRQAMNAEGVSSIRVDQHGMLDVPYGIQEHPNIVNRMWSATGGFDMELGGDWTLRGSYQYGEAQKHNANYGWERLDRFYLAMDAVPNPATGDPMCRITLLQQQLAAQGRNLEQELHQWALDNTSVFRTDAGVIDPAVPQTIDYPIAVDSVDGTISDCAPVNMFGKGNQSQAAMDYIHSSRAKTGISVQKQHFAEILAQGTIWDNWGPGPIEGAIGATYRKESISQRIVDTAIDALGPIYNTTLPDGTVAVRGISFIMNGSSTNLHRFSSQPTFAGGFDVYEIFGETIVPLFESSDGAQRAEINLAARHADYSRAGGIFVWKGGLNFKLTEDLRLRATKSRDIREGSFEELFVQQGRGATICDPWNNDSCNNTFNLTGGNPDLEAEEADTTVFGFVYQPSYVEGLQLSLDRYDVDLNSAIGTLSEQNIVDQCFDSGALCDLVDRDPATGFVTLVRTLFINIDAAKVSGYDLEASYRMEPDFFSGRFESINFRLFGGYMDENSSTPRGGTKIDRAGSANLPEKTMTANINYTVGDLGFNLQHYWQSSAKRNVTWVEGVDVDDNSVPSVNLTNLGVFYNGESNFGSWRLSLNVNNLFDKDPKFGGPTMVGDQLGRRYALGFQLSMN